MKTKHFLTSVLMLLTQITFAQIVEKTTDGKVAIDTSGTSGIFIPKIGKSSKPITTKVIDTWLETGDGFFTTNPLIEWPISSTQNHQPLVHFTKRYDTTKFPPPTSISFTTVASGTTPNPTFDRYAFYGELLEKRKIKIRHNVNEIMPNDPMVFAVIYEPQPNVLDPNNPTRQAPNKNIFKLYFFYNNNRCFDPITASSNKVANISETIPACRVHNGETVSFNQGLVNASLKGDYKDYICFTVPENPQERNAVFISLKPFADLEIGKSSSLLAVLVNGNEEIIGSDTIQNMLYAPAHDPNYIVQRPKCLKFPFKKYPFEYKVHFQNTGGGNAEHVKLVAQLPKGLDWSSIKITKATFAGADYTSVMSIGRNVNIDKTNNTLTAMFYHTALTGQTHFLRGTGDTTNLKPHSGLGNQRKLREDNTTGQILFTINSTPNTDTVLLAHADIYFRSQYPSKDTTKDGYEKPVRTNIASTTYKDCCTCANTDPNDEEVKPAPIAGCYIILGLCWWWWILILLGALLVWYIATRKKKKTETAYNSEA